MLKGRIINLRSMKMEDVPLLQKWFTENEIIINLLNTRLSSVEEFKVFFEKSLQNTQNRRDFIIEEKNQNYPIGAISLENINWKNRCADTVVILGEKKYRRRDYIYDAYIELYNYAFNELNLHKVQMSFLGFNSRMVRIVHDWLEKSLENKALIPIKREGVLREAVFSSGRYHDIYIYGVIKEEYNRVKDEFRNYFEKTYSKNI